MGNKVLNDSGSVDSVNWRVLFYISMYFCQHDATLALFLKTVFTPQEAVCLHQVLRISMYQEC